MPFMAIITFFDGMIDCKVIPVFFLAGCHNPRPLTQRAGRAQGGRDGSADELGAIRHPRHGLGQRFVDLESNNFGFVFIHMSYYYFVLPDLSSGFVAEAIYKENLSQIVFFLCAAHVHICRAARQMSTSVGHRFFNNALPCRFMLLLLAEVRKGSYILFL